MKKKTNVWKVMTIIFGILILGYISFSVYQEKTTQYYDFGGFKISTENFGKLSSISTTNSFQICNILANKCVTINKVR